MVHEVYGKIDEIKVCSCHFDQVFYAIKRFLTTDEIEELICFVFDKIKPQFFFFDGAYIICCIRFIIWAANNHDANLDEIVSQECIDIPFLIWAANNHDGNLDEIVSQECTKDLKHYID